MKKYVVLNKQIGETPLEVTERYRREQGLAADVSLAYAGRLDPMAEGKLLVLIGDECKNQEKYFGLDKEYEFEVLLGFSSDTGDVLGLAEERGSSGASKEELQKVAKQLEGKQTFAYPKFSSRPVQGKPLHQWTLEGRLNEIEIPTKEIEIYDLNFISQRTYSKGELKEAIFEKINSIPEVTDPRKALGEDFRRKDIRAQWEKLFTQTEQETFIVAKFRCICSSGTYMRTLAEEIGKRIGIGGLAFSIKRTKIGRYKRFGPIGFWEKKY